MRDSLGLIGRCGRRCVRGGEGKDVIVCFPCNCEDSELVRSLGSKASGLARPRADYNL